MCASLHRRAWRRFAALAAGAAGALALGLAQAAYPEKPARIVVGFAAGGTTDIVARVVAKELTDTLGQPFVVENRPGAGSNLAAAEVARAAPDGYTLFLVAIPNAINQTLYSKLNYDVLKDFTGVALCAKVPNLLVVTNSLPVKNVKELVAYAKANPGKLAFASSGSGTSIHMSGELFKLKAGVDIVHVPYRGSAPAIVDLISGQVQLMFDNMPSSLPSVQAGKLRALAITVPRRAPNAPGVPAMAESGFPDFDVSSWFGLAAPAGTPPEIVNVLNAVVQKSIKNPETLKRYAELGVQVQATTPKEFNDFIKREVETWGEVVKASGIKPQQ
jgi:tripartite-type tricarboxylate transporter receptor subunit TctC